MHKTLRFITIAGVFVLPFVPLLVAGNLFFPFITGKNLLFRAVVEISVAAWLALAFFDARYRPKRSVLVWAVTAFTLIVVLADIFGVSPLKSFWSNFERMEGMVTLLHLFGYFLVASSVMRTERLWRRLFEVSVGVSVLVGLYGLLQLAGIFTINQGGVRLDATFGNATYLAVYMLFHFFMALWLLVSARARTQMRWVYGGVMVLQAFILYYTATRGAIGGLIGGAALAALLAGWQMKESPRARRFAVGFVLAVVLAGVGFFALRNTSIVRESPVLSRFAEVSLSERTVQSRFLLWQMAFEGFKERPVLGWGQENFIHVFGKYYDPGLWYQEPWFDRAHNAFIDWLIAGGALGFLAYLSLFATALVLLWRRESPFSPLERAIWTGMFAGYAFHNLFVFDNITSYIVFATMLAYIHSRTVTAAVPVAEERETLDTMPRALMPRSLAAAAAVLLAIFALYVFTWKPMRTAQTLLQALNSQPGGPAENLQLYKKALAYNTEGSQEVREQLSYAATVAVGLTIPDEVKQGFVETARAELLRQIEEDPENPRYPLFLGSMLARVGAYGEALQHFEYAFARSPRRQLILFEIGSVYLNTAEYDKALVTFKDAFELATDYDTARLWYAAAALYAQDDELARDLLTERFDTDIIDNDILLETYFRTGNYSAAAKIWEMRVANNPDNPQTNLSLAAAYLAAGERDRAITQVERVISLNPTFKTEGNAYIRCIRAGMTIAEIDEGACKIQ